jgi:hypothetical protein
MAAAVITYLLLKLIHAAARTKKTAAVFFTALRNALFHRIDVETLVGRIERQHAFLIRLHHRNGMTQTACRTAVYHGTVRIINLYTGSIDIYTY